MISIEDLKKSGSYENGGEIWNILEHNPGEISCWSEKGVELVNLGGDKVELIKNFPLKIYEENKPLLQENGNILFLNCDEEQGINIYYCDKNFEVHLIEKHISPLPLSLCNLPDLSFACGFSEGEIKIYSRNSNTQKYEVSKKYNKHPTRPITDILYLPQQKYLISGSSGKTIDVYSLSQGESIQTIYDDCCFPLLAIDNSTFVSANKEEIKFWSLKSEFECIKTIKAHENEKWISLSLLGNDLMVSKSGDEFKIWDIKNYECLKTFKEDSSIRQLIVAKNKDIITVTRNNKVNVWKKISS